MFSGTRFITHFVESKIVKMIIWKTQVYRILIIIKLYSSVRVLSVGGCMYVGHWRIVASMSLFVLRRSLS